MLDENFINPGNLLTLFGSRIIHLGRWPGSTDGSGNLKKLTRAGILLFVLLDLVGAATFVHWLTPHSSVTVLRGSKSSIDGGFSQISKALGKFGI